jgi:hypothetical protein
MPRGLIALPQLLEAAPAGAVRRHGILRQPAAAGELVEVVAGIDGAVEGGQVEARHGAGLVHVGGLAGDFGGRRGLGLRECAQGRQGDERGGQSGPAEGVAHRLSSRIVHATRMSR